MFAETYMFKKKCLRKNISHTPPPEKKWSVPNNYSHLLTGFYFVSRHV